jgi:hypothetical protein
MCQDPRGSWGGRFYENGHYIGHDEPSVWFLSSRPGSGNSFSMTETLPWDPVRRPTIKTPGNDRTHWFELSIAPWFSMTVCDPNSAPLLPCKPLSDANAPHGSFPGGDAAFVEPQSSPGFAPFADSISCDNTHWCSGLNIDSLECKGNGSGLCNNNCVEPVNFAFVQRDGVPPGPPSPQLSNDATFTPNKRTLLNTNPFNCKGHKFNFQPEYSTARARNIIPWGIGPYMINDQYEVGHFEPCTSVSDKRTITISKVKDVFYKHCIGPYEPRKDGGLEPNDSPCFKAGDAHGGLAPPNLVTGCDVFFNAIGDLDFDGPSYGANWPNSTKPNPFPTPFLQEQPTTAGGHGYGQVQFMTDVSATEFNTASGSSETCRTATTSSATRSTDRSLQARSELSSAGSGRIRTVSTERCR